MPSVPSHRCLVVSIVAVCSMSAGCGRKSATTSRSEGTASTEASADASPTDAGDRVADVLGRVVPGSFEEVDGGVVIGPVSSAQEVELRRAFNITSAAPEPRIPTEVLRKRLASATSPADKARARVMLANALLEDGGETEALDLYRAVAVLDWSQIDDGSGMNPTLPARLVLQRRGLWLGSIRNGSLVKGSQPASSGQRPAN